ncbi:translation initiation factor-like protein IF-2 [Dothidotthia symphoricarpi CBS 119687]|uniref:Translation initiation factor IF-2, mitochondrial n=1 Tax=Dothidotthia symphoricarpi CBS 119687 TaxID=1392245 RepID=A0A6A6AD00_9PLEO|nr:translation initiation factor-like protein IF-2 [Dothidotthia symphoricarpi CBS 119687]KAF2129772.1 translation initiation factor-like protein IF-2 [Dothidotthia symphoricarpi CBS 119687]
MRRARGLRVSSTRDICILCATRQLAAVNPPSSSSSSTQRRHLNSSSTSQSAEAILYKNDNPPAKPMSQAERMRQALAASVPKPPPAQPQGGHAPPQAQGGHMSQAQRMRSSLGTHAPPRSAPQVHRQPPPERRPVNRGGVFDGPGRSQDRDRFAPPPRRSAGNEGFHDNRPPPQNRFRVNMDSRPPVNMPAFGSEHLRRRNESVGQESQPPQFMGGERSSVTRRMPPKREMLDRDEISKLLGNNSTKSPTQTPHQPLSRDYNATKKCFHCGSLGHISSACPTKPTLREPPASQRSTPTFDTVSQRSATTPDSGTQRKVTFSPAAHRTQEQKESVADAAEAWVKNHKTITEVEQPYQESFERENKARTIEQERRRSQFAWEDVEMETKNRYDEPERRPERHRGRRRMVQQEDDDQEERQVGKAERKRLRAEAKKAAQIAKAEPTRIVLPEFVSVANLAGILRMRVEDFVSKLEELGFEDVQNDHILNAEHAGLIAQEYNFEPVFLAEEEDGDLYPAPEISPEEYINLPARPPVVTIMGHVDHGKTTILDYMRSTSVAATEFGGITQHIGAFSVPLANGKKITFLDTPGHSAFETMRARGANVTDIVVLVVAADDSVMPQTVEAIKHAQAAKVPMIVAINKMDKQGADADAVKLDLGRHGIEIEDFGGEVQTVCISGKTGQGIPDLEEAISTLSETLDHRADRDASVEGWVLEGTTKKSGRLATVLVRSGILRQGTMLVAGTTWTRVRTLRNEAGVVVEEAGPGIAVEVDGWRDQPIAGDVVLQATDEQHASAVASLRTQKVEREQMARDVDAINESRRNEAERREAEDKAEKAAAKGEEAVVEEVKESGPAVVSFIIKGDVSGSVEAVVDSLTALGNGEVSARILRHGVGSPSEFDIQHAADAQGHIVNFNTIIPNHVAKLAEEKGVKILDSNIIYRVVENVKELLSEKLKPNVIQKVTGEAEIAVVFDIGLGGRKKMKIAGSKVRNGVVDRGTKARVLRGENVVFDGVVNSLKNVKKDVESMRKDTECGIGFEGWEDFKVGDKIQCYDEKHEKRSL